jgi:xanthine dehydrogenase YagS FAD-binding subunit
VKAAHYEIRQREGFEWPLAVAAVALKMNGSTVQSGRVVLGYVAPVPWPSPEAEQAAAGQPINEGTAEKAAEAAVKNATPLSHNAYKVQLTRVAVKRAILKAASGGAA